MDILIPGPMRPGVLHDKPIEVPDTKWRAEWDNYPYVYVRTPDGTITKVYRSYSDYCED